MSSALFYFGAEQFGGTQWHKDDIFHKNIKKDECDVVWDLTASKSLKYNDCNPVNITASKIASCSLQSQRRRPNEQQLMQQSVSVALFCCLSRIPLAVGPLWGRERPVLEPFGSPGPALPPGECGPASVSGSLLGLASTSGPRPQLPVSYSHLCPAPWPATPPPPRWSSPWRRGSSPGWTHQVASRGQRWPQRWSRWRHGESSGRCHRGSRWWWLSPSPGSQIWTFWRTDLVGISPFV